MTTLQVKLNGGAPQTSGEAEVGDIVQLTVDSHAGLAGVEWQVYDYPEGFTLPAGWSDKEDDPDKPTFRALGVADPPSFEITTWGKFVLALIASSGQSIQLILDVPSPNDLHDVALRESIELGGAKEQYLAGWRANIRALDTMVGDVSSFEARITELEDTAIVELTADVEDIIEETGPNDRNIRSHTYGDTPSVLHPSVAVIDANGNSAVANVWFGSVFKSPEPTVSIGGGNIGVSDDATTTVVLETTTTTVTVDDSVTTVCSAGGTITDVAAGAEMAGRVGGQPWVVAIPDYDGQSLIQFAKSHTSIKVAIEQKDSGAGATYQVGPHLGASGSLAGNTVLHGGPLVGGVSSRTQWMYNTNSVYFELYRDNANTRYVVENGLFFVGPGTLRADFASVALNSNHVEFSGQLSSVPTYLGGAGSLTPNMNNGNNIHLGSGSGAKLTGNITLNAPTNGRPGSGLIFTLIGDGSSSILWDGVYKQTDGGPAPPLGVLTNDRYYLVEFYSPNGTDWLLKNAWTY